MHTQATPGRRVTTLATQSVDLCFEDTCVLLGQFIAKMIIQCNLKKKSLSFALILYYIFKCLQIELRIFRTIINK